MGEVPLALCLKSAEGLHFPSSHSMIEELTVAACLVKADHPKSRLSMMVFSLLYRNALGSCFLGAARGAVSKSSLCEWAWLADGPGYSQLSLLCHPQTVSVIFTFRSRLKCNIASC